MLLRLTQPITVLLLDTLIMAIDENDDDASSKSNRIVYSGKQALKDHGIKKLSVEDSLNVLRRKIM